MSKKELQKELSDLKVLHKNLLDKKQNEELSAEEQVQLSDTASRIFDIGEELEGVTDEYVVSKKEKHLIHANLTHGTRFDPETGKEISKPFVQKFSVEEFAQFQKSAPSLGYKVEVIYEPSK